MSINKKRINVLLIDNSYDNTGALSAILSSAISIKENYSVQFYFILPKGSECVGQVKEHGFLVYEIPMMEISKRYKNCIFYFPSLFKNALTIRSIIKNNNIDIVHVNDIYNLIGLFLKLIVHVKVVTHIRRMPDSFPIYLYKIWAYLHSKYSNRIFVVSMANKKVLNNNKTNVVYDPLPP